ncbi:MAG: zinc ribbon domain-containing protein [Conexivisphaerales archaeon]
MEVGMFIKTTGVCMNCGTVQHLNLSDRMVICPSCHSVFDRDVGAVNKQEGLCLGNLGDTLAEDYASSMLEYIKRMRKQALPLKLQTSGRGPVRRGGVVH